MSSVKTVKCLIPFTELSININGYCYTCCGSFTILGNVGNVKGKSIMDIWNSDRLQYIRKAILENKLEKVCNFKYCYVAKKNKDINIEWDWGNEHNKLILEQVRQGKIKMETAPYLLKIATSGKCNLRCIMCESNERFFPDFDEVDKYVYNKLLPDVLPKISRLQLTGNGEVLFNKNSRKFLQNIDPAINPDLKLNFTTNAMLLTPKIWETIKQNNYDTINVSIDAATKETYEKVRKNGNWEVLMHNLILISALRRQLVFNKLIISFVVLKSNYKEIKKFVEMGLGFNCDIIEFQKNFGLTNTKENINIINDKNIMMEIAQILNDPIFKKPEVDTTFINEYHQYLTYKKSIINNILAWVKGSILYYPLLLCYLIFKRAPFLIGVFEFYKNFIRPLYINKFHRNHTVSADII